MIDVTINALEVDKLSRTVAHMIGQFDWISARAMTNAAKASKAKLAATVFPQIQGGPTAWTRRGLMASFARPDSLTSNVGWNYGDGSFSATFVSKGIGVPSGRYMERLATGGDRQAKSAEIQLRRAGILRDNQFITPASSGIKLNAQGNVLGPEYKQILSRLGVETPGSTQSAKGAGSRGRTAAKRKKADFFVMRDSSGQVKYIARRIGVGQRGFVPALFVVDQPNYERRIDIKGVAFGEYRKVFPVEFGKALDYELMRRAR